MLEFLRADAGNPRIFLIQWKEFSDSKKIHLQAYSATITTKEIYASLKLHKETWFSHEKPPILTIPDKNCHKPREDETELTGRTTWGRRTGDERAWEKVPTAADLDEVARNRRTSRSPTAGSLPWASSAVSRRWLAFPREARQRHPGEKYAGGERAAAMANIVYIKSTQPNGLDSSLVPVSLEKERKKEKS